MISRQSLLRLSRDLDEMRRLSAQLDGRDVGGMTGEALTSSQSHFRADLEDASGQGGCVAGQSAQDVPGIAGGPSTTAADRS